MQCWAANAGARSSQAKDRCYGTFSGQTEWFGAREDPETQGRFDTYLAQWLARGRKPELAPDAQISVKSVVARYLRHLKEKHGAESGGQLHERIGLSLKPLLRLHGSEAAAVFSPLKLKAVRHDMIVGGRLCRGEINGRIQYILFLPKT